MSNILITGCNGFVGKHLARELHDQNLDRPETPVFIGGMTQYIEFDEVISKSATDTIYGSQPLGDIAAITQLKEY